MAHEIKDTKNKIQEMKRRMRTAGTRRERTRWGRQLQRLYKKKRRLERGR